METPGTLVELLAQMFMWGMLIQGKTSFWLRLTEDETELLKDSSVGVEKVFRRVWGFEVEDSSTAAFAKALTADGYDKVAVTALTEFFVNGPTEQTFPKQSLLCRGSDSVDRGALEAVSTRSRCRRAIFFVIYSTW